VLRLVEDSDDSDLGPAWFFQAPYDKLVIVPGNMLSPSDTKRDLAFPRSHLEPRGYVAQPGDKPWFCYWNNTLLETFIYINTTSTAGAQQSSEAPSSASASSASESATQSVYGRGYATSSTPTSTAPGAYGPSSTSSLNLMAVLPTMYPKEVKIEERRVPQSPQPYCVQMVIGSNGMRASPYVNSNGQQTVLYINETESGNPSSKRDSLSDMSPRHEFDLVERQSSNVCTCAWRIS